MNAVRSMTEAFEPHELAMKLGGGTETILLLD